MLRTINNIINIFKSGICLIYVHIITFLVFRKRDTGIFHLHP